MRLRVKITHGDHWLARFPEGLDRATDFQRLAGGRAGDIFQIKHQRGDALIGRRPADRLDHIIQQRGLIIVLVNKRRQRVARA